MKLNPTSLLLASFLAAAGLAPAQDAFGYTATDQVPFSFIDLRQSGTAILSGEDDAFATVNLPFAFRFYGNTYTSVCLSVNGAMTFGACPTDDFGNVDITVQNTPGNLPSIYPFWTDLTFAGPGGGAVYYKTLGNPGSRQFVLHWANALPVNSVTPFQFEVILLEDSNAIRFQYQTIEAADSPAGSGKSATVGIRAANSLTSQFRSQWSFNAPVLKNSLALEFAPPVTAPPVNVTSSFAVTSSAFVLNRLTGRYTGTITLTNTSGAPVPAPLTAVLTNLPTGITTPTATGNLPGVGPYFAAPATGSLAPGSSTTIAVQFINPSNTRITFTTMIYSGIF